MVKLRDQKGGHFHSIRNWELRQSSEFSLYYVSTCIVCNVSAVGLLDHYYYCKLAWGWKNDKYGGKFWVLLLNWESG